MVQDLNAASTPASPIDPLLISAFFVPFRPLCSCAATSGTKVEGEAPRKEPTTKRHCSDALDVDHSLRSSQRYFVID